MGSKPMTIQKLPFECSENTFPQGIVVAVTDRSHRGAHPGLATALSEGQGRILTAVIGVVNYRTGTTPVQGHVKGVQYQLRTQYGSPWPSPPLADSRRPGPRSDTKTPIPWKCR